MGHYTQYIFCLAIGVYYTAFRGYFEVKFNTLIMKAQIESILALGALTEIELARLMFPNHRYPIAVLDSVRKGLRELKVSELAMLNALSKAQISGQFFSVALSPNMPGLWFRCLGYELAILGNEVLFYKSGVVVDRQAADASDTLETFLLNCLATILKLKENE